MLLVAAAAAAQRQSAAAARGKRRCLALLRIIVLAAGAVLLALALAALIVHPNFGRFLDLTSRTKPSFWILKGLPPRSPDWVLLRELRSMEALGEIKRK